MHTQDTKDISENEEKDVNRGEICPSIMTHTSLPNNNP